MKKFRAWDKQLKEMFDVESINFNKDIVYVNSRERDHIETQRRVSDEVCTLMQYIGLKDKNGKEIYEGDFVKFTYTNGEYEIDEVYYDNNDARFRLRENVEIFDTHEVIGNIYENPELVGEVI